MKYKAVIFDFDDTLVESRRQKWDHHKFVAKKFYDLELSEDDIKTHWGKPFSELMALLYRGLDTVENIYANIIAVKDDFHKSSYPGVVETIDELLKQNIKVGVVSAAYRQNLIDDFERLGFPYHDFFIIQGSDDVEFHKPDPKVFSGALEKTTEAGIGNSEVLYVGDSIDDCKAALGAGIDFVGVTTGLYSKDEFLKNGADKVISSLEELLSYIK